MNHTVTHTAIGCLATCPRRYEIKYLDRIRSAGYRSALAVGSAVHFGVEWSEGGHYISWRAARASLAAAQQPYDVDPDTKARDYVVTKLLTRAWWRYLGRLSFSDHEIQLRGAIPGIRGIVAAGVVDGYLRTDGERYELKTTGGTIAAAVVEQRQSLQPSIYALLDGCKVPTVLDVVRKPRIRRKQKETWAQYYRRCVDVMDAAPDGYAIRTTIDWSESKVREASLTLAAVARVLRHYDRHGYPRRHGAGCMTLYGPCEYRNLCWREETDGYVYVDTTHDELDSPSA